MYHIKDKNILSPRTSNFSYEKKNHYTMVKNKNIQEKLHYFFFLF